MFVFLAKTIVFPELRKSVLKYGGVNLIPIFRILFVRKVAHDYPVAFP